MKRALLAGVVVLLAASTAWRLGTRYKEEQSDKQIALLVDWQDFKLLTSRKMLSNRTLLERAKAAGATGILLSPSLIQDYLNAAMVFPTERLAKAVQLQLAARGVYDVRVQPVSSGFELVRTRGTWLRIQEMEVGFDPDVVALAQEMGLGLVLRINHDPWLAPEALFKELGYVWRQTAQLGILLNTETIPGGSETLPEWTAVLEESRAAHLLFEFKPSKSARRLARSVPLQTFRSHTIAPIELRDLTPEQERSRWLRAVEERSCRFLLLRVSSEVSLEGYSDEISDLRKTLLGRGWIVAWPSARPAWKIPSFWKQKLDSLLAFGLAAFVPIIALVLARTPSSHAFYFKVFAFTLLGACLVAAIADNPMTRLQIVPFRGVKAAFLTAWVGSFLVLFSPSEMKIMLARAVQRQEILFGALGAAVIAYFLLRTGNAGASWKPAWEQGLRDGLEHLLVARPRFKEFALGYPLLYLGIRCAQERWGRLLIGIGMIGPITMVNTFCHLHSPILLAFLRSINGFILGTLIGMAGYYLLKRCRS